MPSLATNSNNTLTVTVRDESGTLIDPDTIELVWKLGRDGDETTVPQGSLTHVSTGIYTYAVNPADPGNRNGWPILLKGEWRMTNPTYVERFQVALSTSEFAQ